MAQFKNLKWYGTEVYNKIHAEQKKRVLRAAIFLESYIRKSMKKGTGNVYMVAGRDIIGRVGTNVEYARYLELGTKKMAPRPYLRRAIEERINRYVNGENNIETGY